MARPALLERNGSTCNTLGRCLVGGKGGGDHGLCTTAAAQVGFFHFGLCVCHGGGGGRLQPVLMRHTPQLSVKTRGGGGLGGCLGGVGWRV